MERIYGGISEEIHGSFKDKPGKMSGEIFGGIIKGNPEGLRIVGKNMYACSNLENNPWKVCLKNLWEICGEISEWISKIIPGRFYKEIYRDFS